MVDLRSEIFRLRAASDPPPSYAQIARQLGTNKSRVQRELKKSAREPSADPGRPAQAATRSLPPALQVDPELLDRQRSLELDRLATQQLEAEARRLEAQARLEVLKNPGGGGQNNQLVAVMMNELSRIREQLASRAAAPAGPPPASLTDQLTQTRQMYELMRSFAPPTAPSSSAELEFKVAMERLNVEERRISKQYEAEMAERQERLASQRNRDEAVARAIDQWAPVLGAAAERWMRESGIPQQQGGGGAPLVVLPSSSSTEEARADQVQEIKGPCPRCGAELAMTAGGEDDHCPACGVSVLVANGAIGLKESGRPRVQTFAS